MSDPGDPLDRLFALAARLGDAMEAEAHVTATIRAFTATSTRTVKR
jgi:hypothetical protein